MTDPKYLTWLQDKNLAPTTIRLYLDTLARFNQTWDTPGVKEYFKDNLAKYAATSLKVQQYALNSYLKFQQLKIEWEKIARLIPKVQKKFFATINEQELVRLKSAQVEKNSQIYHRNNLLLDFLFYSGVRINELVHLRHSDWESNQLKIHGKGNKVRYVLLPEFLVKLIDPYSKDYLFTNSRGKPIKAEYIRWLLKQRTLLAQIKKRITPHTFRRSFATLLNSKGARLTTIQKLLGHSNLETTAGYIHNSWEELYLDYSKLWREPSKEKWEKGLNKPTTSHE